MAKISRHFVIIKQLQKPYGSIEFSGIVHNNDPEQYDIEDVRFHTTCNGKPVTEDVTQFFRMLRETTDPEYHHEDICALLSDWLLSTTDGYPSKEQMKAATEKVMNGDYTGDNFFLMAAGIAKNYNDNLLKKSA